MNSEPPSRADIDNRSNEGEYQRMENRLTAVEHALAAVQADVAVIRSNYATKEDVSQVRVDLLREMNSQTWRVVTWVTAAMGLYSGLIYLIVRQVD